MAGRVSLWKVTTLERSCDFSFHALDLRDVYRRGLCGAVDCLISVLGESGGPLKAHRNIETVPEIQSCIMLTELAT